MTKYKQIAEDEINSIKKDILNNPNLIDPKYVIKCYKEIGIDLISSPFSKEIILPIEKAIKEEIPYSVIRLGDGEMNIMTYGVYKNTPELNKKVIKDLLAMQQDTFSVNKEWMIYLQEMMYGSAIQADIIGILGLWRAKSIDIDTLLSTINEQYRWITGYWRGVDYMLKLAENGFFATKILTSANLYLSIIENLERLINISNHVLIISDKEKVYKKLQQNHPYKTFEFIKVGTSEHTELDGPYFLSKIYSSLKNNLKGYLVLIGAGPWSEFYCSWVKQLGGVAIDIGSGFDLLNGDITRPVHQTLKLENSYHL